MSSTVDIPQTVKDSLHKFRLSKSKAGSAAMVFRVNVKNLIMEEVETFDNISIKDLVDELPENAPRFIVLSYGYEHKDGRKSFPLLLINWAPRTAQYGLLTLHASCSLSFEHEARVSKVIEAREPDELTREIIDQKLSTY